MQTCFGSSSVYCCVIVFRLLHKHNFLWRCTFVAHIQERTKQSFFLVSKCRYQKHQFLGLLLLVKCGKKWVFVGSETPATTSTSTSRPEEWWTQQTTTRPPNWWTHHPPTGKPTTTSRPEVSRDQLVVKR